MKKENMSDLLETLKKLRDQTLSIRLYSEEIYEHFSKKIESLEQALINVEDDKDYENSYTLNLVSEVTKLEFEVNHYMKTGRLNAEANLVFGEQDFISGQEMEKQHRIGVYKSLVDVISEMKTVDVERLKKLKEQWDREKDKYNYSEVERDAIEKALANAYIEYQIKTCSNEGKFPDEPKEDFCLPEFYESELKKKIVDHISTLPKESPERLELESYFINWDLPTIMKSTVVWKALSGREPEIPLEQLIDSYKPAEKATPQKENQEKDEANPNNLPLDLNGITSGNAVLIIYENQLPNGAIERKRKIKPLDEKGRFKLFFNKDKVVRLFFLEGTKELSFTKKGKTKGSVSQLADFPNLREVYLPSTLRTIEQGYFYNCANLESVHLANGTYYKPNPQLFPENTKIVEGQEKTDKAIVINEPEEQSVLFTQKLSTGERKTIKIPLKDGCIVPKSFTKSGIVGVEEARFTKGTKEVCEGYWTNDYDSYYISGGVYSDIQGLRKIVLPEGLRDVGPDTFKNCRSLEEIEFSDGIERLGLRIFDGCTSLKTVILPSTLRTIDAFSFEGCSSLQSIDFPDGLERIEQGAFKGCEGLQSISLPENFDTISQEAFKNCYNLKKVKFPTKKMGSILDTAFENCASLGEICFPHSMGELRKDAFLNCSSIERVLLPREYKKIEQPFKGDKEIKYVVMPNTMSEDEAKSIFDGIYYINFLVTKDVPEDISPEAYLTSQVEKAIQARQNEYKRQNEEAKKKREQEEQAKSEDNWDIVQ